MFNEDIDINEFVMSGGNTRITVISANGFVLGDTHATVLEGDYLTRPEIISAADNTHAVYVRFSNTLGLDLIYYALRVPIYNGYVFIRTSIPVESVDLYLRQSLPLLIILLLALMFSTFILVRSLAKRISAVLQANHKDLQDEKDKLTFILNSIGDALFVADVDSNITLVNNAALDVFASKHDVKKLGDLVSDKDLVEAVEKCINNSKSALFELMIGVKVYLVTVKPLPDTLLTMSVLIDITESKETQKRKEDFFANASHELKTPLTAIKGYNELAQINNTNEKLDKYIASIARETDRMMSLIADMLKLSELETMHEVASEPVMLSKVIAEAVEGLSPTIAEKNISLEIKGDATISCNPEHIYEVVKNLIENAVRYNRTNGKVAIRIKSKNTIRLTVSDTGIGMPPQEQHKIFERFYRVEKSRSVQGGGTGLVLAIVKHICALYGWRLSLSSKLGEGTDIHIEFT